ncbi:hypothetical protein ABZP36_032516 [Zizania latifolia]
MLGCLISALLLFQHRLQLQSAWTFCWSGLIGDIGRSGGSRVGRLLLRLFVHLFRLPDWLLYPVQRKLFGQPIPAAIYYCRALLFSVYEYQLE